MTDKQPTQASGGGDAKGKPDGVNDAEATAGESGGGAYPNPHTGKKGDQGGWMGHGGQTEVGYHGGGQSGDEGEENVNAGARTD